MLPISIVEKNVTVEKVAIFKQEMMALQHQLVTSLHTMFPHLSDKIIE